MDLRIRGCARRNAGGCTAYHTRTVLVRLVNGTSGARPQWLLVFSFVVLTQTIQTNSDPDELFALCYKERRPELSIGGVVWKQKLEQIA
jgi:hypothetical protein